MSIFSHSSENSLMFVLPYKFSISLSHIAELASLGILQSPRGLIEILPTLGPSGKEESGKPFLDGFFIIRIFECRSCQIEYLGRPEAET